MAKVMAGKDGGWADVEEVLLGEEVGVAVGDIV